MTNEKSEKLQIAEARWAEANARVEAIEKSGEHQLATQKVEVGWLGRIFGRGAEKHGNIAGAAIGLGFLAIMILVFWAPSDERVPFGELITLFATIITLALGFLIGKSHQ